MTEPPTSEVPSAFSPAKRKRKAMRLGAIVAAIVVLAIAVAKLSSRSPLRGRGGHTPSAAAVEDPATLVPIVLAGATPEADDVFATRIMRYVIELNRAAKAGTLDDAAMVSAEAALGSDDTRRALGDRAFDSLRAVVTATKSAMRARADDEPSVTALDVAVARLDNALIAARLPYFVDASVIRSRDRERRLVLLYEFAIVDSSLYESGASRVRTVRLRRADRLNWSQSVLGFVNLNRAQAVVLLDPIDEQLARQVLPALADHAPMPLVSASEPTQTSIAIAIGEKGGEDARSELGDLHDVEPGAARALGEALRARRALYDRWNGTAKDPGLGVRPPRGLAMDLAAFALQTEGVVTHDDLEELRAIQQRLEGPEVARAYAALRDAFAASVERHEAQHRLDALHAIPMPAQVERAVRGESAAADDVRDAVKNELSAYLAQIARDERMPRTTLTLLVRFLVNPKTRGSTESHVAIVAVEELAHELGVVGASPLVVRGRIDEARLIRAHRELTSVPPATLTAAARRVWARLFGRELPPLALVR
jgi:hypothetical protein